MNATPDGTDAHRSDDHQSDAHRSDDHQSDAAQTAKDRSYSPSSERETEMKQEESGGAAVRPGTGGPDDVGDIPVPPEDDLDAATIIERGDPGHRAGDA